MVKTRSQDTTPTTTDSTAQEHIENEQSDGDELDGVDSEVESVDPIERNSSGSGAREVDGAHEVARQRKKGQGSRNQFDADHCHTLVCSIIERRPYDQAHADVLKTWGLVCSDMNEKHGKNWSGGVILTAAETFLAKHRVRHLVLLYLRPVIVSLMLIFEERH